jgi:hypothetical protein
MIALFTCLDKMREIKTMRTYCCAFAFLTLCILTGVKVVIQSLKVKVQVSLHTMKAYRGTGGTAKSFLTSELYGDEFQLHVPATLPPVKRPH